MKIGIFILILISIVGVHGVGQGHVRAQGITMGIYILAEFTHARCYGKYS